MKIVLNFFNVVTFGLLSSAALGSTVAIIDSGTDYKHKDLAPRMWVNPGEVADNAKDDDGDGFVDDVYGWNFAESNKDVIDYSYLNTFSSDCEKYFKIQGKTLLGTATDDEKQWLTDKKADTSFMSELETFANFVHGTHVAGISSTSRSVERLLSAKIIATKTPGIGGITQAQIDAAKVHFLYDDTSDDDNPLIGLIIQYLLGAQIDQQMQVIVDAAKYAGTEGAQVANGSFGSSYKTLEPAIKKLLAQFLGHDPSDATVKKYTDQVMQKILDKSKEMLDAAPKTLFVFAAGNDGTDNDELAMSPANLKADNTIAVAATLGFDKLASFSNYGKTMVDVAAPGVVINSTIPGDKYLELSGTSMAAPYVTEIAALAADANPALKPVELKRIILETVDVRDWLAGKVKTSGVVNTKRAVAAAQLTRTVSLDQAIAQAKTAIADNVDVRPLPENADDSLITPVPLPSFIH